MPTAAKTGHARPNRLVFSAGAVLMSLIFLVHIPYAAQDATLSNLIVTNTSNDLLVYLNVEGAFREQTVNAIMSGVPASFSFFIKLYQKRSFWFDKAIADIEITNAIKYNSLKKEYMVKRLWDSEKTFSTQSLQEAQKFMTEIEGIKIAGLKDLQKGEQYQIRVKAELNKKTLPLYLHHVLFFVSLWDFETDWYTIDFIY